MTKKPRARAAAFSSSRRMPTRPAVVPTWKWPGSVQVPRAWQEECLSETCAVLCESLTSRTATAPVAQLVSPPLQSRPCFSAQLREVLGNTCIILVRCAASSIDAAGRNLPESRDDAPSSQRPCLVGPWALAEDGADITGPQRLPGRPSSLHSCRLRLPIGLLSIRLVTRISLDERLRRNTLADLSTRVQRLGGASGRKALRHQYQLQAGQDQPGCRSWGILVATLSETSDLPHEICATRRQPGMAHGIAETVSRAELPDLCCLSFAS